MNIEQIEQEVKNNLRNKEQEINQLRACLDSQVEDKERAYCSYKLGMIKFFEEGNDIEAGSNSIKYLHFAYKLAPDNSTYANIACLYNLAEIAKYSNKKTFTASQAKGLLNDLMFNSKCQEYPSLWQKTSNADEYIIAQAANNLGLHYREQERTIANLKIAKFCFKLAHDVDPYKNVAFGANLAAIHYELGETKEATLLYLNCLNSEISTNFTEDEKANCANALTLIYFKDKDYVNALSTAKQASILAPDNAYYIYNLASAHFVSQEFDQAKDYYQQCSESEITTMFTEQIKVECLKGLKVIGELDHH